jgi:hypothetical protein
MRDLKKRKKMKFSLTKYSRGADYSRIASFLVENSPNNRVMAGTRGSIPIGGNKFVLGRGVGGLYQRIEKTVFIMLCSNFLRELQDILAARRSYYNPNSGIEYAKIRLWDRHSSLRLQRRYF